MMLRQLIKCRINNFYIWSLYGFPDIRYFLRSFIDQKYKQMDLTISGTDAFCNLLLSPEEQEVVYALHKILSGNKAEDMLEDVLKLFVRTKNNKEFIYYVKKSLLRK